MNDALEKLRAGGTGEPENAVNIVFLQMESFFDVTRIEGVSFSRTPTPMFDALRDKCSTDFLTVPALGGGTVNTEFEVLVGMRVKDFGMGEYPFKTVLRTTPCESLARNLSPLGYKSRAIHNYTGTFYDRDQIYPMLGFDAFTPLEYMQNVSYNELGWPRDAVMTGEIISALEAASSRDFIFAVTAQTHSGHPGQNLPDIADEIKVEGLEPGMDRMKFEYFVNQLNDADAFLGDLTKALSAFNEPVLLVVYGDHLPALDVCESLIPSGRTYETRYLIWSNFGLEKIDKDLYSYQLAAEALSRIGIGNGILTKLHQSLRGNDDYIETLKLLEYDMLYGERYVYGGVTPYAPSDMTMGTLPITLSGARLENNALIVTGENFTPFSKIISGGKALETEFIDARTLRAKPASDPMIAVAQFTAQIIPRNGLLSQTPPIVISGFKQP